MFKNKEGSLKVFYVVIFAFLILMTYWILAGGIDKLKGLGVTTSTKLFTERVAASMDISRAFPETTTINMTMASSDCNIKFREDYLNTTYKKDRDTFSYITFHTTFTTSNRRYNCEGQEIEIVDGDIQ